MRQRTATIGILAALTVLTALPGLIDAQITRDVVYGHKDGLALTYDVVPPTGRANGAAVVFMVSGGWVSRWSAPEDMARRDLFRRLADRGFTTYVVRHGSSPRFKVPDAIEDVRLAVAHIREHAADHGVDAARIGLTGSSAGGHLSLAIGLRAEGGTGYPDDPANERVNQVAAIVAYFPPVDLRGWSGPSERYPALDFDPELEVASSPLLYATDDDPPTLLLHGDEDRLVPLDHSERMFAALTRAGVETEFVVFSGAGHGFQGEDAERGVELTVGWFEKHLVEQGGH